MKPNNNLLTLILAAGLLGAPCALHATFPPGWAAKAVNGARPELVLAQVLAADPNAIHLVGRNFGPFAHELAVSVNGVPLPPAWYSLENGNHIVVSHHPEALAGPGGMHEFVVSVHGRPSGMLRTELGLPVASPAMLLGPEAGDPAMRDRNAVVRLAFNLPQPPWSGNQGSLCVRLAPAAVALPAATDAGDEGMDLESAEAIANDPGDAADAAADQPGAVVEARRTLYSHDSRMVLRTWFQAHLSNPYPTRQEQIELALQAGLSEKQVGEWFVNTRKRHWYRHPTDSSQNALWTVRVPGAETTRSASATRKGQAKPGHSRRARSAHPGSVEADREFTPASRAVLLGWARQHLRSPYPTIAERHQLASAAQLSYKQVSVFFINYRLRDWPADCAAQGMILQCSSATGVTLAESRAEGVTRAQPQTEAASAGKKAKSRAAKVVAAASAACKRKPADSDSDYAPSDDDGENEPKSGPGPKRSKR